MNERFFSETFLRRLDRLALIYRKATISQLQGERRSHKRGQSIEFSDFRSYSPGDDFRRIDWNAFARLERLFIKLFIEEEDLTVHFLIDASTSMKWGLPTKLEYAAKVAGALGYIALVKLDRVTATVLGNSPNIDRDFAITDIHLPPKRGKKSALSLFSFLQSMLSKGSLGDGGNPESYLSAYAANTRQTGPLLLLSDLMNDGWRQGLNILGSRGYEVTIIHILSPDEISPGFTGDFRLVDSETQTEVEVTADNELLELYQHRLASWQESWSRFSRTRGMQYLPIATSMPLEELLFTKLPIHGILK